MGRTRARIWLARAVAALALAATFAAAALVGLASHVNLPQVRRLATRGASRALSAVLRGRVEIAPLERVWPRGLETPSATLYDVYGRRVLTLHEVRIGFDPVLLAEELLSRDRVLTVIVHRVRAERAEAEITPDPTTGEPTIVGAFAPRASESAEPGTGRPLRLFLPSIEVGSATLRATFRDVPPLEADVMRLHGQLVATQSGIAVDVTRFGAVLRGFGADARGTGTLAVRAPGATRSTFEGFFGDIELSAAALVKGRHVELSADIPSASPAAVRTFVPDWPLVERVSAHVEAKGEFPELRARATVTAGRAVATVEGPVVLGERRHATLKFAGQHLDARILSPRVPATDVAIEGDIDAENVDGAFSASVRAHADETEVDGFPVPALDAEATIKDGTASGAADIHEPGMPTHATFHVSKGRVIDLEADAKAVDFKKVRKLPQYDVNGMGGARLRAHIEDGNLSASLEANTANVEVSSVRFKGARVSVQARGPLGSPEKLSGTAHVTAKSVTRGAFSFDDVLFDARGSLSRASFEAGVRQKDGPEVALAGTLALTGHPLLRDTKISLKRDPVLVEGEITEFDPDTEELYVRSFRATGVGGPLTGSARLRRNLVELEADGENLDLDVLARALALPRGTIGGRARLSLSLAAGRDITRGHLRVGAGNLTIGTVGGVSTEIFADLEDAHLTGGASGIVLGLGTFGASWDVNLGGPAFQIASFQSATGRAEVQLSDIELARIAHALPDDGPIRSVEGRGYAKIEFSRTDAQTAIPDMKVTAATRGLAVVLRTPEKDPPYRFDHVDINASGHFDGASGETDGNTLLYDSKGDLASFTGSLKFDTRRLLTDPKRAFAQLVDSPIEARASIARRRIADLPEMVRVSGLDGEISADVLINGTLAHPTLRAGFDGRGVKAKGASVPVDLHAEAQYDATDSAIRGRAEAKIAQEPVATATLTGSLPSGSPSDFHGTARLDLNGLPFDLVGALSENNVRGNLFGTATMSNEHGAGALLADLRVVDASVDRTPLGEGRLHVSTDATSVKASLTFSGARGHLDANGSAGLAWNGPLPVLSTETPVRAGVVAKDFSAAAFSPLLTGLLSRVGGRIDANVTVALEARPSEKHGSDWVGEVDGSAVLHDGTILVDVLGLDVNNVSLRAQASGKGGKSHITIADVKGSVRSSSDNIRGSADLELEGVKVVRGNASVYVDDTPILFRGAPQGRATGNAALHLTREEGQMLVDVDVPTMALRLPESSARSVIDVADNTEIVIVQNAVQEQRRSEALPWSLLVHLGNAVSIHRSDIELKVTGTPIVSLGYLTQVGGSVELVPGGRLPVLGQVFIIERGLVTFDTGVPENPTVNVTAVWRAPNDTLVYVEVTGTLREAEVTLRSDPPLPEAEVFALLFGGGSSPDSATAPNSNTGSSAAGAAALQGPVQQLNRVFGQSPVELRVGTTSESRSRYTAAVRVRENLWFEASTYQQSEYAAGGSTNRNVVSGTIDYRFTRKWSLRTEAGTAGGALDLLWQHRY